MKSFNFPLVHELARNSERGERIVNKYRVLADNRVPESQNTIFMNGLEAAFIET